LQAPALFDTSYPRTGTSVMTALDPGNGYTSVDIITFGGQDIDYACPRERIAASTKLSARASYRLRITWPATMPTSGSYSFGSDAGPNLWLEEDMVGFMGV
jgi:hypothetical protein